MQQMERLIAASEAIIREDIQKLQRLAKEFEAELAFLGTRVDNLEGRVAFLEDQQFSTTTKLTGKTRINFTGLTGFFGEENASEKQILYKPFVMDYRTQLNFDTSFTGKDLLKLRLEASNTFPFDRQVSGTNRTRLANDENTNNQVEIDKLFYRFSLGDKLTFTADGTGGKFYDNVETFNPFFSEEFTGSVSRFGRFNPIYYQGEKGAGISLTYDLSKVFGLSLGYLAPNGGNPNSGNGLFNGSYAGMAQLRISPTDSLSFGLSYVNSYFPQPSELAGLSGGTGSILANQPFGDIPTSSNQWGLDATYRITPSFILSGWVGLTYASAESGGDGVSRGDQATIFNWAVTFAVPDLGSEGSVLGLVVGQPPKVTANDGRPPRVIPSDAPFRIADDPNSGGAGVDENLAWHFELFYRYQVNENISIGPGLMLILNPDPTNTGTEDQDPIVVYTLRTVFEF
jgi:hypothetical protein